jgi:phosphatidate cytidylyltransferase
VKDIYKRSLTGILYLAVFVGSLLIGKYTFAALFLAISLLALHEFYNMVTLMGYQPMKYLGMVINTILFLLVFYIFAFNKNMIISLLIVPLLVLVFILELYRKRPDPLANISYTLTGILYISLPITLFNKFAFFFSQEYTSQIILGFFILLWINDTAAYIFGISFGKHRLFERISPKKSWEGFVGGTVITVMVSFLLGSAFTSLNRTDWIITGLIISICGVFGDLVESMFKRTAKVKDSGKILPGHGGMLDRFDSVLLTSPIVFVYLMLVY